MRHRLVPKNYSPDDPTLQDYWRQRRARTSATDDRYRHSSIGKKESVLSAVSLWKMARIPTFIMGFPRNAAARMTSPICGWFTRTAIVRFTAATHLWKYVNGLSRMRGDSLVRF